MNCIDSHCDVVVYASLYAYVSQATKMPLATVTLINTSWKDLRIKIANTHKQAGSDDCGSRGSTTPKNPVQDCTI